jgi:hypothetical protein
MYNKKEYSSLKFSFFFRNAIFFHSANLGAQKKIAMEIERQDTGNLDES